MATHANSTTAPACPLLPPRGPGGRFARAPLPSAAELLAEIADELDRQEAESIALLLPVPAPLPPLTAALSRRRAIFGAVAVDEPDTAAQARAIHLRRQLEAAAEHGADFLVVLGLPQLVGPDHIPVDPVAAGNALDQAIAALDAIDGDTDREPYLAGYYNGGIDPEGEREPDSDDEESLGWTNAISQARLGHGSDDAEPSLASPERHPTVPWSGNWRERYVTRDRQDTQARWADGGRQDLECHIDDEPHDGDGEDLEAEPAEDSLGSAAGNGDQTHWTQGEAGEREADPADGVRLYKGPAEWDATFARRDGLRDLARRAHALRRRAPVPARDPDTVTPIGPGMVSWAGPGL